MKATVYYIELTEPQRDELNAKGWNSPIGQAYLAAKDGHIDATNFELIGMAAIFEFAHSAEHIWISMQNRDEPWTAFDFIPAYTDFPRSMDIGDIIVWEDGRRERCVAMGFEAIEA